MALGLLRRFRIAGEADAKQERFEENRKPWGRKLSASRELYEVILGLLVVGKEGKRGSMIY